MINAKAHIEVFGPFAEIDSRYETLLAPLFTCLLSRFAPGGSLGHRRLHEEKKFYDVEDGHLFFPAGMVADVVAMLKRAGTEVTVTNRPYVCKLQRDEELLTHLPDEGSQLLQAVGQHFKGLIQVNRKCDLPCLIGLILKFFCTARILIAVGTNAELRRLHRQLVRLGHDVKTIDSWTWGRDRLHICSLHSFDVCNRHDWDMVILPDAVHAATKSHAQGLVNFLSRPMVGFLLATDKLSAYTRLWLHWACGPVIYKMPDPKGYAADVTVAWLSPPVSPPAGHGNVLDRKRHGLWHNDSRNDSIAGAVKAIAAGDIAKVWEFGLMLDKDTVIDPSTGKPLRVAILTESTEHAKELHKRLPGWKLMSMAPADCERRQQQALKFGLAAPFTFDKTILTTVMASQFKSIDVDILVRADGSPWNWHLRGFPPRSREQGRQVMLIDIADDFDADAIDGCRCRQRDYAGRGWSNSSAPAWLLAPVESERHAGAGSRGRRRSSRR